MPVLKHLLPHPIVLCQVAWTDYVGSNVCAVAGNAEFVAVGCLDGSLYVYSPAGRRVLPAIMLGCPAPSDPYPMLPHPAAKLLHTYPITPCPDPLCPALTQT